MIRKGEHGRHPSAMTSRLRAPLLDAVTADVFPIAYGPDLGEYRRSVWVLYEGVHFLAG